MQVHCVMDILNSRIHMYNTTGGVALNKFCRFLCKRRVPILIILRSIMKYGIVCGGGGGLVRRDKRRILKN